MKPDFFLPLPQIRRLNGVALLILLCLMLVSATVGKHQTVLPQLTQLLFGGADAVQHWLFWQLWLPRTLLAVGVGASLALSGCLFQVLSRNPLGSPDIIGINAGAAAGAVAVSLIWVNSLPITLGALLGALLTLILVLLSNGKRATLSVNMVIGGLAVNALAMALVQFGLTGVRQEDAYQMNVWLSGSLAQRTWHDVAIVWTALPVCLVMLFLLRRPLALIQLNPNTAASVGVSVFWVALLSLLPATILATTAVVAAGPIAFIALSAPHLARKLFRAPRPLFFPTALVGAILLLLADILTRFLPISLPVGVLTAGMGGLYLLYLIMSERKKNH